MSITCLFAHDTRLVLADGRYHSRGNLPKQALGDYADAFGRVVLLTRFDSLAHTALEPITDPRISFLPQPNVLSPRGLWRLRELRANIEAAVRRADVVIARLPSQIGVMVAREARRQGAPYLVEVVGNAREALQLHGSKFGRLWGPLLHRQAAEEIYLAKNVVYITERYLQTVYPTSGRMFIVPNVRLLPQTRAGVLTKRGRRPRKSGIKIGLIGSLDVDYKGHQAAIEALALLRKRYKLDASLEFAGGGSAERWLAAAARKGVQKHVRPLGSLRSGAPMMEWIDSLDLLLQPSKTEAQGRAIVEGMGRGCPVVASSVGGIVELIEPEWLTSPHDLSGLARRCAKILRSQDIHHRVSLRNYERAMDFSVEAITPRRAAAYAQIKAEAAERRALLGESV